MHIERLAFENSVLFLSALPTALHVIFMQIFTKQIVCACVCLCIFAVHPAKSFASNAGHLDDILEMNFRHLFGRSFVC